ncbi:hypothetical protein Tco_0693918 [Tanacetum coccineum]
MVSHVNWLQCSLQAEIMENNKNEVQFSLRSSSMTLIYLNTLALFLQLVDEHTAEDDIEFFSTEPGLDRISAHNFLTRLQKLSLYAFGHLKFSELAVCLEKASFSCTSDHVKVFGICFSFVISSPSQTDTPETDKN